MTLLTTHVKPVNKSITKHFVHVGVGVKERGGVRADAECLDQCANQTHVCSLAEETSWKWRRGKRAANRRVNVSSMRCLRVIRCTLWYSNLNHRGDSSDLSSEGISSLDNVQAMVCKEEQFFFSIFPCPGMCFSFPFAYL